MEKIVIIGGGIAGLSCQNALLDLGENSLLLEGTEIGTPKMCGEFLAPTVIEQLREWDIGPIQPITQTVFYSQNESYTINFAKIAGAFSRRQAELQLATRSRNRNATIKEHCLIQKIIPSTNKLPHEIVLTSGERIQAHTLIFATGKFAPQSNIPPPFAYHGFKFHFNHVIQPQSLLMHSFLGGYIGVVPIAEGVSNCACLVSQKVYLAHGSGLKLLKHLLVTVPELNQTFDKIAINDITLLDAAIPKFQLKKNPDWPRVFWIGDALASFYPAIGAGFAHSVQSAVLASKFYADNDILGYRHAAPQQIKNKLWIGHLLHRFLLHPFIGGLLIRILKSNSWISNFFLKKLDYL